MGYGDKLMAIGDAWAQHQSDPLRRRVAIGNGVSITPEFPELEEGLTFLATPESLWNEDVTWIVSYRGKRPYIDYAAIQHQLAARGSYIKRSKAVQHLGRYLWRDGYHAKPAPIVLNAEEQAIYERAVKSGPFAIIEPYIKANAPPSKQWPVERFFEVGHRLKKELPVYQFCPPGREPMDGFLPIHTERFRAVLPHLKAASLYIGPEGGLHHAAAATGTRAVVIFGGFISPKTTGYQGLHINLTGDTTGWACGTRYDMCPHCQHALDTISADDVVAAAHKLLEKPHG